MFPVFLAGRRDPAERPRHRDSDQDRHLRRQDQQHQHQPGQVRSRASGAWRAHAAAAAGRLTTLVFPPQHQVYTGSGERRGHRLHAGIGAHRGQGEERTPVCGEARILAPPLWAVLWIV